MVEAGLRVRKLEELIRGAQCVHSPRFAAQVGPWMLASKLGGGLFLSSPVDWPPPSQPLSSVHPC